MGVKDEKRRQKESKVQLMEEEQLYFGGGHAETHQRQERSRQLPVPLGGAAGMKQELRRGGESGVQRRGKKGAIKCDRQILKGEMNS